MARSLHIRSRGENTLVNRGFNGAARLIGGSEFTVSFQGPDRQEEASLSSDELPDEPNRNRRIEECVVGVYDSSPQAEIAVRILKRAGFRSEQISLAASSLQDRPILQEELRTGDDSVRDAAIGVGLGGILGLLAGIGLAAIPVAGMIVFLIGPIGGAATGSIVGGLVGSMVGWGVRKDQLDHYEQFVREGKVLLVVNGGNPLELAHAERILRETDALEVNLHARTGSDAPEVYRD